MAEETVNLGAPDEDAPKPDPGNSGPEAWTEPMHNEEQAKIRELLNQDLVDTEKEV